MLSNLNKVEKKPIIASTVSGVCLAGFFLFKEVIFGLLYAITGIAITIISPGLTFFILYLFTAPAAIAFSSFLSRQRLKYDKALIAGMISNYTFCAIIILLFAVAGRTAASIYEIVGIIFFATLFGFILAALAAVINDKIYPDRKL